MSLPSESEPGQANSLRHRNRGQYACVRLRTLATEPSCPDKALLLFASHSTQPIPSSQKAPEALKALFPNAKSRVGHSKSRVELGCEPLIQFENALKTHDSPGLRPFLCPAKCEEINDSNRNQTDLDQKMNSLDLRIPKSAFRIPKSLFASHCQPMPATLPRGWFLATTLDPWDLVLLWSLDVEIWMFILEIRVNRCSSVVKSPYCAFSPIFSNPHSAFHNPHQMWLLFMLFSIFFTICPFFSKICHFLGLYTPPGHR